MGEVMMDGVRKGRGQAQKTVDMLDWCLKEKDSVDYRVSLRWMFYRAMVEFKLTKVDYVNFKNTLINARKNFLRGWKPNSLVDDTRKIHYNLPFDDVEDYLNQIVEERGIRLEHLYNQPKVILVCFEAEAMRGQFEHYLGVYRLPLIPFKGDGSLDLKWNVAKLIEYFNKKFNKPIEVDYFGDLDKKGLQIPDSAFKDVRKWCKADFKVTRIGLLPEHVERFNMQESYEKKGAYQWEALSDDNAKELFKEVTDKIDLKAYLKTLERENIIDEKLKVFMSDAGDYVTDPIDDEGEL
jgi:hypothetical protein